MSIIGNSGFNVVYDQQFDPKGHTNENSLAHARLTQPDHINSVLTFLQGRDDDALPLTFLTEGQNKGIRSIEVSDVEYTYDVISKMDKADEVMSSNYTSTSKPGVAGSKIRVVFKTNWLKKQHTVVNRNGDRCRVVAQPEVTTGGYLYTLELVGGTASSYVDYSTLTTGAKWAHEGPGTVSESLSYGNESSVVTPGKVKNQISILRKSYHIGGNISNKVVEVNLPTGGGKAAKLWMPFEEWQHETSWKKACEEHLWFSTYNRDANGQIRNIDEETGLPVPHGMGLVAQIPNVDTYSELTVSKLDNTVLSVMYGRQDEWKPTEVVLYTGIGGAREFDNAMKSKASSDGIQILGDKYVSGSGHNLVYGGYYNAYKTKEGLTVIVKLLGILDHGGRAKVAPVHPSTGLPATSYEMYFVDQTTYDGVPNLRMVTQKGRSLIRGMEQGMSLYKGNNFNSYKGNSDVLNLSTGQDKTSVHFLSTKGIQLNRNQHCFKLSLDDAFVNG